ncbi:hypothetical protein GC163_24385 [bacterium]|nr:hypothetical protein [bacterium]
MPMQEANENADFRAPNLSVAQRWFQAVVTHPDGVLEGAASDAASSLVPVARDTLERMVTASKNLSAEERLSIYAHAYHARLIECLGETLPATKRTLGTDAFNGFAFGYLQAYPSNSYTLNHLADRFADYLENTRPEKEGGAEGTPSWPDFLIDLARLESAVDHVFDGPGIEGHRTLDADTLLDIPTASWPGLQLMLSPCVRLLGFRFPVNAFYTAMRSAMTEAIPTPPAPLDSYLVLSRRDYVVRRLEISRAQFELLSGLADRQSLLKAIAVAAEYFEGDDDMLAAEIRRWFSEWTRLQLIQGICPSNLPKATL